MKIDSGDFKDIVQIANSVAPQKTPLEYLTHVWMKSTKGVLTIRATDLEVWIESSADCKGDLPEVLAPSDLLAKVSEAFEADIMLTIESDKKQLVISSGESKFKIPVLAEASFPVFTQKLENATDVDLDERFINALARVVPFIVEGGTAVQFSGAYIKSESDALTVAAGSQRCISDVVLSQKKGESFEVILPPKTLFLLQKYFKEEIGASFSDKQARFSSGNMVLTTALIAEKYPKYRMVGERIKEAAIHPVVVNTDVLIRALKRCTPFLHVSRKDALFTVSKGEMKILVEDGSKSSEDKIAVEFEDTIEPVRLRVPQILEAAKQSKSDRIIFRMGRPQDPIYIEPFDTKNNQFSSFAQVIKEIE